MSILETPSNSPPPSLDTLDEGTGPATEGAAGLAGSAGGAAVIGAVGEAAVVGDIPPSVLISCYYNPNHRIRTITTIIIYCFRLYDFPIFFNGWW